jgi:uncharacterized protein
MADERDKNRSGDQGGTENRGFASMDPEKQREIASKGGKASRGGQGGEQGGQGGENR